MAHETTEWRRRRNAKKKRKIHNFNALLFHALFHLPGWSCVVLSIYLCLGIHNAFIVGSKNISVFSALFIRKGLEALTAQTLLMIILAASKIWLKEFWATLFRFDAFLRGLLRLELEIHIGYLILLIREIYCYLIRRPYFLNLARHPSWNLFTSAASTNWTVMEDLNHLRSIPSIPRYTLHHFRPFKKCQLSHSRVIDFSSINYSTVLENAVIWL